MTLDQAINALENQLDENFDLQEMITWLRDLKRLREIRTARLAWYRKRMITAGNNAEALSELMTVMEREFMIPAFKLASYEAENHDVMVIYREIASRRVFED